ELATGPIALCEVQGYVYAAKWSAADLAALLGKPERAQALRQQADELRDRFEKAFWCEELSTYALALDGQKRPCRVRTSNAGHCLATGIARPERARRVAESLLSPAGFAGWGIRTVAGTEARFNPMSYHNGSIWPHDNALIAHGLARYGLKDEVVKVLTGIFDLSLFVDQHRVPELICGFERRPGEGPTLYPVACAPQAWSAASVYMLLQACLGMEIRAAESEIHFFQPLLPQSLRQIRIKNLQLGENSVDLVLDRHGHGVGIEIERREGPVRVVVTKL
ncbi:MAG TPA: amylo-alpha-1,6-glucosidase, partial [Isosphaeraceae bacterium]|nr:amylo-alpha-1,6-glucosidase [Isosphaeraceae bacterium]